MFTAFYLRVSTADQTVENQAIELRQAGFEPTASFEETGVSGKTRAIDRPAFAELLKTLGRVNGAKRLVVTKVDRLGRNASDVLATVDTLRDLGCSVYVLQLGGADLASAAGKLILTVMSAVAEMERSLLVERTHAGLERAKAQGKTLGRPQALSARDAKAVAKALAEGASVRSLATQYGVARPTIRRLRAA
ncbi:MAG: recombinase family protein [Terricaulis sp.]